MVLLQQEFVSSQGVSQAQWKHKLNSVHRGSVHCAAKISGVTKGEYCRGCICLQFTGIAGLEMTAATEHYTPKEKNVLSNKKVEGI